MATIPANQARGMFTDTLAAVYRERIKPTGFLRSYFPTKEVFSKYVSIAVQRGTEKVAVDVTRGSEANRNKFGKSTEKTFEPPYYNEAFNITEMDLYDRVFGSNGTVDSEVFMALLEQVAECMLELVYKIERAYELQCSQALTTGIVTLKSGDNIDFKRKAASLVNKSATPWTTGTVDPITHFQEGCDFLRSEGKVQGGEFHAIVGSTALNALFANDIIVERSDVKNISTNALTGPLATGFGSTYHGYVSAGSYLVHLFGYSEIYENEAGNKVNYIDPKKVIMLPPKPDFNLIFAAVPQLIDLQNPVAKKGAYLFQDFPDARKGVHEHEVKSAGVAVPTAIDQIYTMQTIA